MAGKDVVGQIRDARLGRVGYDHAEIGVVGQSKISLIILIRVDAARNHVDDLSFDPLNAADDMGVKTILPVQAVNHALFDRLNNDDAAVIFTAVVQLLQHPVGKSA